MIAAAAYWIGMGVTLVIGLLYFRDLGDVSQMLIRVKRESMKRFIRNEYRFIALGFAGLVLMTVAHFGFGAGSLGLWWVTLLLTAVLYGFPYVWVHVGLRNQKNSARFYSIGEASEYVAPSNQVLVLEKRRRQSAPASATPAPASRRR